MSVEQITTIVTNILQGSGVSIFIYYVIKSLRRHIVSLKDTITAQQQTLEAMERRVAETEKIGETYRKFLQTMPEDLEKYQTFIRQTKDQAIAELERTNQLKDERIRALSTPDVPESRKKVRRVASSDKLPVNKPA